MYRCTNCGCVLDEEDLGVGIEYNEYWGSSVTTRFKECCNCHSPVEEVVMCDVCLDYVPESEINRINLENVCDDCLAKEEEI